MSLPIPLPDFNHPEVSVFYEYDLSIPREKVVSILELPRASLIADMELMIKDGIDRNEFFRNFEDQDKWWEFPIHALWILVELQAEEAMPTLLELLRQDYEFSSHFFGDFATENLWEVFYHLGGNSFDSLKKCCVEKGEWINRIVPSATLEQIALHQPEKWQEVVQWFGSTLEEFLAMEKSDPALDIEVISSVVCDAIDIQAVELLPLIKKLFDQDLVLIDYAGDYAAVEKDIQRPTPYAKHKVHTSIFDRYQDAMTWHSYRLRYDEDYKKKHTSFAANRERVEGFQVSGSKYTPFRRDGKKIGRNDPCPCGSGKKYKKCCL